MATMGNIIFGSMIVLIIVFASIIILFLALTLSNYTPFNVKSRDRFPVANLGGDVLLSCHLSALAEELVTGAVEVTWTKADLNGVVYKYQDRAPQLADQNPQFDGRTQVFADSVARGNGSLLMMDVRDSDGGVYTCRISASTGDGSVDVHLRTAAYSTTTFSINDSTLTAMSSRWLPEPQVTWLAFNGTILQGITQFSKNSAGMYRFVSSLKQVGVDDIYTFRVRNQLVTATSTVTITGSAVAQKTRFSFSAGLSLSSSKCLLPLSSLLMYAIGSA